MRYDGQLLEGVFSVGDVFCDHGAYASLFVLFRMDFGPALEPVVARLNITLWQGMI